MPTLLLLRHAKSSWNDLDLQDFERPLAPRGERAAPRMGRFLRENDFSPHVVLCSSAVRAKQTLELALPQLAEPPDIQFSDKLYLAAPNAMLALLRKVTLGTGRAMIVGHNPGLHALALRLCGGGKADDLAALGTKFPTAALAVIDFEGPWDGLGAGSGELRSFTTPRQIG